MEDQATEKAGAQHLRFPVSLIVYYLNYQESGHWSHFRSNLIWVELDDGVSQRGQQLLPEVGA